MLELVAAIQVAALSAGLPLRPKHTIDGYTNKYMAEQHPAGTSAPACTGGDRESSHIFWAA